jgi:hypothetical protein
MVTGPFGDLRKLARRLRGKRGAVKTRIPGSAAWAELEQDPTVLDLEEFVLGLAAPPPIPAGRGDGGTATPPARYLHDWSLPQFAPDLMPDVVPLPHFAGDLIRRCADGTMLSNSWPSLFVGPAGTQSSLHVDSGATHFWMAVTHGTKFWRVFPRDQLALLNPVWTPGTFDPHLACGAADGDPASDTASPALCRATPWEGDVQAGDVIFIPANCAHFVLNRTDTIAVSANFIDSTNLHLAQSELGAAANLDPRVLQLVEELERVSALGPPSAAPIVRDEDAAQKRQRVSSDHQIATEKTA